MVERGCIPNYFSLAIASQASRSWKHPQYKHQRSLVLTYMDVTSNGDLCRNAKCYDVIPERPLLGAK